MHRNIRALCVAGVLIGACWSVSVIAEEPSGDWLRGAGKDLQIRLRGEVLESDGQGATGIKVTGSLNTVAFASQIEAKIDGHQFEFWFPVNQPKWYSMWLKATSTDGDRVAYQQFNAYELRQAAIDGIKLTLRSPTREVRVKVVEKDQPVTGAYAKADLGFGIELRTRTNADGIARFGLLPEQKLSGLMAWTDDFQIGGFDFDRKPTRDPDMNEQLIELSRCRDRKLRFVDEVGSPVAGVDFVMQIATPDPNYNYIGTNEHSRMMTDAAGEAIYKWFPDWDGHYFYVELKSDRWVLDGEHQTIDDAVVFKLKKSKIADRKRVLGRVVLNNKGVGGFFVKLNSFQGEQKNHSDVVQAFTNVNGAFSVEVLPDATYYAYVLDSRWVSEMIDFIPYESESERVTHRLLTVSEGELVEVMVVSGPQKKPCANMTISFRREHELQWLENGETKHGAGAADWWAATDESGRAFTRTLPGKLKVSVYSPLWQTEQTFKVTRGVPAKVQLYRENDGK
jgi:hypothetical protein